MNTFILLSALMIGSPEIIEEETGEVPQAIVVPHDQDVYVQPPAPRPVKVYSGFDVDSLAVRNRSRYVERERFRVAPEYSFAPAQVQVVQVPVVPFMAVPAFDVYSSRFSFRSRGRSFGSYRYRERGSFGAFSFCR